jgi:hypothetical protein
MPRLPVMGLLLTESQANGVQVDAGGAYTR